MKVIKSLCVVSMVLGYLCILCSAKAEELHHISQLQCDVQTIVGFLVAGGGVGLWHILA
jgi:hypothetical protein